MSILRGLARFAIQPHTSLWKLSVEKLSNTCHLVKTTAAACDRQQCCSLLSFMQSRLVASGTDAKYLLGAPHRQQLCLPGTVGRWQQSSVRGFATKLRPRFTGCKLKPYSSYKERFKMTGTGKIRYMRPGAVHKHFNKSRRQNAELSKTKVLYETYAKTMRKLGFKMRSF